MPDHLRVGDMGNRSFDLVLRLGGRAHRLPCIVQRLRNDGAIGRGVETAVKVDIECEFAHGGQLCRCRGSIPPGELATRTAWAAVAFEDLIFGCATGFGLGGGAAKRLIGRDFEDFAMSKPRGGVGENKILDVEGFGERKNGNREVVRGATRRSTEFCPGLGPGEIPMDGQAGSLVCPGRVSGGPW
jgi:hypothetical protein